MLVRAEISITYSEQFVHGVLSLLLGLVTVLVWGLEVLGVTMGVFLTKDLGLGFARGVNVDGIFIPLGIEGEVEKSQFKHNHTGSFSLAPSVVLVHLGCHH